MSRINVRRKLVALPFGITTDAVISAIDIDPVMTKDNKRMSQFFRVSIAKLNDKGKKVKESTVSLGYLPDSKNEKMFDSFKTLINRTTTLLDCYLEQSEYAEAFDNIFVDVPSKKGAFTCTTPEDVNNRNWREPEIFEVFDRISTVVAELLQDHIGLASKRINTKLVFNKNGYITAPMYGKMFEPFVDEDHVNLVMTRYDLRTKTAAGATTTTIGVPNTNAPAIGAAALLNI